MSDFSMIMNEHEYETVIPKAPAHAQLALTLRKLRFLLNTQRVRLGPWGAI